jgi:mono/diheme cytochrome c family protein
MLRTALLAMLCAAPLHAQDGGQLYTLYCSACHGVDGKGATGGTFPPLAGSDWILGDAARPVKIVLHGLHGEIEVDGRKFNLEMPPQGGVLPDDQIAAILTYARSSWGNQAEAVTADFVKAMREATAERKTPWTQEEILKLHPLPAAAPPIANLISQVYHGTWKEMPDFTKLKAKNIEEEHDGKISVKDADVADQFAIVWEGEISAPETGDFEFRLDADDGALVKVDGKPVVEVKGVGAMDGKRAKQGKIRLSSGVHKIRIEYFEYYGNEGIALAWKGPGIPGWKNLSDNPVKGGREPIPVAPVNGRAVVYRNFIAGTTPRAIGIGFPGGVNLAYSADHLAPELIWTGEFMDASRHWIDRGQGDQAPAGEQVVKLGSSRALPENARFRGYKLDTAGNPTFSSQIGNQFVLDEWKPAAPGGTPGLTRSLSVKGQGSPVEILVAEKLPVKEGPEGFDLGDALRLKAEGAALVSRDGKVVLKVSPGKPVTLTYSWK